MNIPSNVQIVLDILHENGHSAYLVGGCVRDHLLNREPKDYDISTSAKPEEVQQLFDKTIPTGIKHGTVTVVLDGENIEVTTYRKDGNYSDGRRPDSVEFAETIEEDLSRRDFTMNAIAFDGENYIDPFNGREDLQYGFIRAVGKPLERLKEDALRMLRAIRFAGQLGFNINIDTMEAIKTSSHLISNVSIERQREELCKILQSDKPSIALRLLHKSTLLQYIIPELNSCVGFDQYSPYHDKCVFEHTLEVLDNVPPFLEVRLAALFHDTAKPNTFSLDEKGIGHFYGHQSEGAELTQKIMQRLKFDTRTVKTVSMLVNEHMSRPNIDQVKAIKKLIRRVGVENLNSLFKLQEADIKTHKNYEAHLDSFLLTVQKTKEILEEKQPFSVKDLDINGHDLIEIGFEKGRKIGEVLNKLLELVLDQPELNTKTILLGKAKNYIK
ncbi:CCA tRNA nucleotidyltransferase [Brevibacillus laterosporus]|uniref:CCA tRNA nucleotidyltransferase n=1 Tax=Brevibacillus laterosporus TaxID=1465 RepID=A0A518VCG0_BRELA|nr:CCA tRNA nucleotidyltransferase [Brevibacillus laterosporus]